jgi:hypothetical protein
MPFGIPRSDIAVGTESLPKLISWPSHIHQTAQFPRFFCPNHGQAGNSLRAPLGIRLERVKITLGNDEVTGRLGVVPRYSFQGVNEIRHRGS